MAENPFTARAKQAKEDLEAVEAFKVAMDALAALTPRGRTWALNILTRINWELE